MSDQGKVSEVADVSVSKHRTTTDTAVCQNDDAVVRHVAVHTWSTELCNLSAERRISFENHWTAGHYEKVYRLLMDEFGDTGRPIPVSPVIAREWATWINDHRTP